MKLFDAIDDILLHEGMILPKKDKVPEVSIEEGIFNRISDFIINLEPDRLNIKQVDEIINIIEVFEFDDIQERVKLAKMTNANKNQYSKKWYSKNKNAIKKKKDRMARSSQGRKRARMKNGLGRVGKTSTGRNKVRYHVRKKGE